MDQSPHDRTPTRRRRRALVALLLSASLATLGAGAMSLARFTDTDTVSGSWSTGTIVLGVTPSTAFTATGIMPGDSGEQTITVANNGTGDLRYSVSTSATDPGGKGLAAQLGLTITPGACPAAGSSIYTGSLDNAHFGTSAQGGGAGERDVAAGLTDELCFAWDFPLTSGDGYQNASTVATFTFAAEQTDNNP